jgi:trimeric autotransporter adhesin
MSTKTTFKRIALVAVAALGFGVLTSVAADTDVTAVSAGTPGAARVGLSSGTTTITVSHRAQSDSYTVTAQITSAPTDSAAAALDFAVGSAADAALTTTNDSPSTATASVKTNKGTTLATADVASIDVLTTGTTGTSSVALSLTADVAGTYQILVAVGGSADTGAATGNKSVVYSITTAGAPTTITAASYGGSVTTSGVLGQLQFFTLKDAAGNATILGTNESIDVTDNSTAVSQKKLNGTAATSFSSADVPVAGRYFYRVVNDGTAIAADGTAVVTFAGNLLLPATLTTNITATLKVATAATGTPVAGCTTTANCTNSSGAAWTTGDFYTTGAQSITWTGLTSGSTTAAVVHATEITDGAGLSYNSTATIAAVATTAATKVAATAPAVSATMTNAAPTIKLLTALTGTGVTATVRYLLPAAKTVTVLGSSAVLSATGGSTTWNVEVDDQFGNAVQYAPVSVTVSGRNTVAETSIGVTDANGIVSYTLKDAGTTGTRDSITFKSGSISATAATVTYGTVTVSKVSFTGGSTTAGVADTTPTVHAIEADQTPESATQDAVVTVTDAAGNLLAGVPVAFTVSDATKLAITTTTATVYTGSNGKATAKVYAWIAGTYTVTATAGGVTGTGSYTFANSRPADARVLSASAVDGVITAKVVDRFGNPVSGVTVYASRTSGTGYFGSGASKTTSTTGVDGTAEFTMIGTAEVKVSTLDYNALPGVLASGQTAALAGNIDAAVGATAATAFTATTAGTVTANAKNVGSSFAPAGVSTVTVSVNNNAAADNAQAATDAAAEATDAANAATDAANAAAEAADAATAAAQDAADAVAALSTQVTELVSALRKQITSLTNLVIKIQKKVRA